MPDLDRHIRDAVVFHVSTDDSASPKSRVVADDHDSPWKEALELYFPQALALLASDLHAAIDWAAPIVFLDKELQAVLRASAPGGGRRYADKLVRVQLVDGNEALLLVHVEVQGRLSGPKAMRIFGWRMLEYQVLICQRERRRGKMLLPPRVYSLGILIDQPPHEASTRSATTLTYRDDFLLQQTRFTFPIVELEVWRDRWGELDALAPVNPFAVLIMAQLQATGHPDKSTRLAPLLDKPQPWKTYSATESRRSSLHARHLSFR
jgi:hypothetical protein